MGWLDKQYQPLYLEGIGEVLAKIGVSYIIERFYPDDDPDAKMFYDFFHNLDPAYKRYVLEGVGKSLSYFYSVNTEQYIHQFINTFKEGDKKTILKEMMSNLR